MKLMKNIISKGAVKTFKKAKYAPLSLVKLRKQNKFGSYKEPEIFNSDLSEVTKCLDLEGIDLFKQAPIDEKERERTRKSPILA